MILLLSVLSVCALGVYALRTWQAVRLAQVTDSGIRAEWADFRGEVKGAVDELVRQMGDLRDDAAQVLERLNEHDGRLKLLEDQRRQEGFKRVAGVR